MKKTTKLLSIIVLAVIFIPLFSSITYADFFEDDVELTRLKEFANQIYSGIKRNPIYYVERFEYNKGYVRQYITPELSGDLEWIQESQYSYYMYVGNKKSNFTWTNTTGTYNTSYGLYECEVSKTKINPILILTYEDWLNNKYPINQIPFEDLSTMPVRELPYYMFYEDGEHNYWYQEYGQIPVFNLVGSKYADFTNMEFEVNWNGIGGSKTYKYNSTTNTWDLYFTDSNYYISVPYAENWFKIHRANFDIQIGDESVTPSLYEKWNSQDPTIQNNLKLISPAQPIKTVHDKLRLVVKYTAVYDSKSKIESKDISIFPSANANIVNIDYKKTMSQEHMKWYDLVEKTLTFDVDLLDPILIWENNKTTIQIQAVIGTKKDKFGNVILQGHSSRIFVEIEKSEMIDSDGDGRDDNTGETGHWDTDLNIDTENELPTRSQYPNGIVGEIEFLGDTLLYWVKTPFTMFRNGLLYITQLVNETFSWTNSYATFVGRMFSFLPGPVIDMLGLMFMVIIITTLIKVVRG